MEHLRFHFSNYFCGATGEKVSGEETDKSSLVNKEKSGPEPIIIPIVLKMAEFDHKVVDFAFLFQMYSMRISLSQSPWSVTLCVCFLWFKIFNPWFL